MDKSHPIKLPDRSPVSILGVPVDGLTMAQTVAQVEAFMAGARLHQICTPNPEFVMAAQRDHTFYDILNQADLCIPDGVGLLWAARWLGQPIPERVPGSELVYHLAAAAAAHHWPLFLLGAAEGVAEQAGQVLQTLYPGLIVAGSYAGSPDPAEDERICGRINASGARLLYVAYGAPQQDKWIHRNRGRLTTVQVAIGVGGALDFISGKATRAPRWMQHLGVEWLYRLWREPWRWRRMLALPRFVWRLLWQKAGGRG